MVLTRSAPTMTIVAWKYCSIYYRKLSASLATLESLNSFSLGVSTRGPSHMVITLLMLAMSFALSSIISTCISSTKASRASSCYRSSLVVVHKVLSICLQSSPRLEPLHPNFELILVELNPFNALGQLFNRSLDISILTTRVSRSRSVSLKLPHPFFTLSPCCSMALLLRFSATCPPC